MEETIHDLNKVNETLIMVIRELRDIGEGVERDFYNIGNDVCAHRIFEVANEYQKVRRMLYDINRSDLIE